MIVGADGKRGLAIQRDYEFNALSAASAVVMGHTSNGKVDWKDENGPKLKDL